MDETWASWFRQNFDKIILFFAWLIALLFAAYLIGTRDASNLAWGREMAATVLGAFLGLVTGSRLAAHAGSIDARPGESTQTKTTSETASQTPPAQPGL